MKVKFPFEVKYEGRYYTANVPFEVEENRLEELISIGGVVVEERNQENITKCKKARKPSGCKSK